MTADDRPVLTWARHLALAYAGGLVLGAPLALTAVWFTGSERVTTACLLATMALLLIALRRRSPADTDSGVKQPRVERQAA